MHEAQPEPPVVNTVHEVDELIGRLPRRSREMVSMRYGLRDGIAHSLAEVASNFHLTRERIRQILQAHGSHVKGRFNGRSLGILGAVDAAIIDAGGTIELSDLVRDLKVDTTYDPAGLVRMLLDYYAYPIARRGGRHFVGDRFKGRGDVRGPTCIKKCRLPRRLRGFYNRAITFLRSYNFGWGADDLALAIGRLGPAFRVDGDTARRVLAGQGTAYERDGLLFASSSALTPRSEIVNAILGVFRAAGAPLSLGQIQRQASLRSACSAASLRQALQTRPEFRVSERGLYEPADWRIVER